jgi:predicted nucleic acid-binding protein
MEADRAPLMTLIIDASIAVVWFLPDEESAIADATLHRVAENHAFTPDLFWHEMRNVLLTSYRRKRISRNDVWQSMSRLGQLDITTVAPSDNGLIITLADRHGLTAYDAAYLALAIERQLPLATLDRQLVAAAPLEGIALIG